jgi:4-amino-4-deoxy-L-arabinose transferase-like glycosyltransferase
MLLIDELINNGATGWGMFYLVGAIYSVVGRNMLAVQFFNAVIGAATAPIIFMCAHHIFGSLRVSRIAALFVAFYPSLILWSSQGLKDGPIVFLLALIMLATLKLGERLQTKYFVVLALSLAGLISLRFYIFYMAVAAVVGSFLIGMRPLTSQSLARQFVVVVGIGLVLTYFGVLRRASAQLEVINLQMVQTTRADLAGSAQSGFGKEIDVSTTSGALTAIPVGVVYLLFAPFPWQLTNLRQSITLPEMLVWWASFPLLVLGAWFTVKFRLRQALPILIFTTMLTLAYSIFQGNVGTAYRQRSQILVFYFIFVAVGAVLLREQQEDSREQAIAERRAIAEETARKNESRKRFQNWKRNQEKELEEIARGISERIDF